MKKKTLVFFLLKLIKIPLTVFTLFLTARFFGISIDKDIWLLGFSIIQTIDLAVWGPVNETFRTKFITLKESSGEEDALLKTRSLLAYLFLGCIFLLLFAELFAFDIAKLIAPNYNKLEILKLTKMIRLLAPWLLLNQVILIGTSILNSYDIFYIPEISSFVSQIINVLVLLLLAKSIGILSLVIVLYVSSLVLLLFIIYYIFKQNIALFSNFTLRFDGFKIFFLFALPFFASYFFGQLNGSIEKIIAVSLGNGVVSVIDFSRKIPDLISGVLTSVILSILVPNLTRNFLKNEVLAFNSDFNASYKLGLFVIGSIFMLMVVSAGDVTNILYSGKQISNSEVLLIGKLTVFYTLGILGVFTYIIFGMSMMATQKVKLYVICGIAAQILVIAGNFFLSKILGIYAFPISYFLAHLIAGAIMYHHYPFARKLLFLISLRYYAFFIAGGAALYYLKNIVSLENENLQIITNLLTGIVVIFVSAMIFKIEEIKEIRAFISKKMTKA